MDLNVVTFAVTIVIALIYGVAYSLLNYLTKTSAEGFNVGRFVASLIFGIFVGIVMVYQGANLETLNWSLVGGVFFAFQGVLMWLNTIVDYIWFKATGQKVLEKAFK